MHVRRWWAARGGGGAIGWNWTGRFDNFDAEAGAGGHHVRDYEGAVLRRWAVCGKRLTELFEAEGGEDGDHGCVVREVEVEGLVEGEDGGVGVFGDVVGSVWGGDEVVLQPSHDFLLVSDSEGAGGGRVEGEGASIREVDGVFETFPFFVGEEGAPSGVTEGDRFVGAKGLCRRCIAESPVVASNHVAQSGCSILQID